MFKTGDKINKYEIISILGSGSFGIVYLVKWQGSKGERRAALKILKTTKFRDVVREAITWVKVSQHTNVLKFIDIPEYDNKLLLLSEYAPDGNLQDWITNCAGGEGKVDEAIELFYGILNGLEHLHKNGVIHRDIKPANILFNEKNPLLADFGFSRELELSQSDMLGGTIAYLSPELFNAWFTANTNTNKYKRSIDDDLWAVSITFYQMLTGFLPFQYPNQIGDSVPFVFANNLPAKIKSFLTKSLNKDKSKRYKSAEKMIEALKNIENNLNTKDAEEEYRLGYNSSRAGKYKIAVKYFSKAIKLNPRYAEAYMERGLAYIRIKKFNQAVKDLTNAIKLSPKNAVNYNGRGVAYFYLLKYDKAIKDYKIAIQLDNYEGVYYQNIAHAYSEIGDDVNSEINNKIGYALLRKNHEGTA